MNFFQLVLKQMRQRALSTWLTLLSVTLAVALAVAILILQREGNALFGQSDYGYDLVIGPKGSKLQLVLNTVYHVGDAQGTIPYEFYEQFPRNLPLQFRGPTRFKVPYAVGDTYKGHKIVGTLPKLFGVDDEGKPLADDEGNPLPEEKIFQYRLGKRFEFAEGRAFHGRKFEAVVGSEVAKATGLALGSKFKATHGGESDREEDQHDELWTVVGILKPTRTANDRVLFIPLTSFYAIPQHEKGLEMIGGIAGGGPMFPMPRLPLPKAPSASTRPVTAPSEPDEHEHAEHDEDKHEDAAPEHDAHEEHEAHEGEAHKDAHDDHDAETRPADGGDLLADAPTTRPSAGHGDDAHHDDHGDDDHAGEDGAAHVHEEAYELNPDGTIELKLPKDKWRISAVMVRTSGFLGQRMSYAINNGDQAMAVNPAAEMRQFFDTFLYGSSMVLLGVAILVTVVAAVSILVSIYNSVAARTREIAILRALGATRLRVLTLFCFEAGLVGLLGGLLGMLLGHLICAGGSGLMRQILAQGINWVAVGRLEWVYLAGVVAIALLAGLVPALKAYRTPVATNLVAA